MVFQDIETVTWNPEKKEQAVEGYFIAKKRGGDYNSLIYTIRTEDGKLFNIFGNIVLDDKMELVDLNDYVRITFNGKIKNKEGKKEYKDYGVARDPDRRLNAITGVSDAKAVDDAAA